MGRGGVPLSRRRAGVRHEYSVARRLAVPLVAAQGDRPDDSFAAAVDAADHHGGVAAEDRRRAGGSPFGRSFGHDRRKRDISRRPAVVPHALSHVVVSSFPVISWVLLPQAAGAG